MRLIPLVIVLVASGCASLENRLVYYPAPSIGDTEPLPPAVRDVMLSTADNTSIHARWCPNLEADWVLLYCHGNAGNLEGRGRSVHDLHRRLPASVLIFDYPGYGRSKGKPSEAGCYASAQAAYDWLTQEQGICPTRILLCGESLGGGVAVELASRNRHAALVLIRSFCSLPDVASAHLPWLPCQSLMINRFDNESLVARCGSPLFIAQADRDEIMPFDHGQKLKEAHGKLSRARVRTELYTLSGLGHSDPLPEEFFIRLRNFLGISIRK